MNRINFIWLSFFLGFSLSGCSEKPSAPEETVPAPEAAVEPEEEEGDQVAVIGTEHGDIVVRLLPELAPKTVDQFVSLSTIGFYTRTTFHYVSPAFIMGGDPFSKDNDPYNDGLGNSQEWIDPEFNDDYKVNRGAVGMLRKDSDPKSSSCQFFIVLEAQTGLGWKVQHFW